MSTRLSNRRLLNDNTLFGFEKGREWLFNSRYDFDKFPDCEFTTLRFLFRHTSDRFPQQDALNRVLPSAQTGWWKRWVIHSNVTNDETFASSPIRLLNLIVVRGSQIRRTRHHTIQRTLKGRICAWSICFRKVIVVRKAYLLNKVHTPRHSGRFAGFNRTHTRSPSGSTCAGLNVRVSKSNVARFRRRPSSPQMTDSSSEVNFFSPRKTIWSA